MINFVHNNTRFNYRVAGVTIVDGRVLLHTINNAPFWSLPGGRCEMNESSAEALKREYLEETGYSVTIGKPLWFVENFFTIREQQVHEISMIYAVGFADGSPCLTVPQFEGVETDPKIVFQWFPLAEVKNLTLYPTFLSDKILAIPEHLQHIIQKDNTYLS